MSTAVARPWETPWWRPHPSHRLIFFYLVGVHVLAVMGLILFPVPDPLVFGIALGLVALGGIGTTVCFHRALSHKALKLDPWLEQVLIFFTVINGSGSPTAWVANHRLHHAKSDTDEDVSSPRHGFWWSHLRWLYQHPDAEAARWCRDIRKPRYEIWQRLQPALIVGSLSAGGLLGWEGFFWIGAIRLVYSLHGQCTVNSVAHMGRNPDGSWGVPINIAWLGPMQLGAWGENWHANHHEQPGSARLGRGFWQTDIGWQLIRGLRALGLARDVREPRQPRSSTTETGP